MPGDVTVIDYGTGNLKSILSMLKRLGASSQVASSPSDLKDSKRLIIGGVGAFDDGVLNLRARNLIEPIKEAALDKRVPVLGICLGMQLLAETSEEGVLPGLALVKGRVRKFDFGAGATLRVPHIGWNYVEPSQQSPLMEGLPSEPRFYFVHSYHLELVEAAQALCTTEYGYRFQSGFQARNIAGVQFHPEKSHRFGKCLLRGFLSLA